jgi:hypothetical protein
VQAYETFNAPEFLFNIAQAYRQDGNCERALFFYRRYLAAKPSARNRTEVEGFMKELEGRCKAPAGPTPTGPTPGTKPGTKPGGSTGSTGTGPAIGTKPSGGTPPPTGTKPNLSGPDDGRGPDVADSTEPDDGEEIEGDDYEQGVTAVAERPHLFAVRAAVGPSFPSLGENLDIDAVTSVSLGVGHPFYVGRFVVEAGLLFTYTPLPWEARDRMDPEILHTGTAGLFGFLADVGASYEFVSRLSGRLDVGAGALLFSGLSEQGNPFLEERDFVDSGAIPLFNVRVALGAEYAVTNNFTLHAEPVVFSYSPSSPLRDDIDKITRFEMMVGAGYRM